MNDKHLLEEAQRILDKLRDQPSRARFQALVDSGLVNEDGEVNLWWDAKFAVVAISQSSRDGRIRMFRCLMPFQGNPGAAEVDISRETLIKEIEQGNQVITATFDEIGKRWTPGETVYVTDNQFLQVKTKPNGKLEDDLGELPHFKQTTSRL